MKYHRRKSGSWRRVASCLVAVCAVVFLAVLVIPAVAPSKGITSNPVFTESGGKASPDWGAPSSDGEGNGVYEVDGAGYVPGSVLVELNGNTTLEQFNDKLAQLDYIATERVAEDDVVFGYVELALADGVQVEDALSRISAEGFASAAQPNYIYHMLDAADGTSSNAAASLSVGIVGENALHALTTEINDKLKDELWGLKAVKAYEAWDTVKVQGAVTVAVVDTGLNMSHEDFDRSRIVGERNFADDTAQGNSDLEDAHGHGTHVAGIVAATANNAKGVAGVSYNANIMPVKILDSRGNGTTAWFMRGLNYVCQHADEYNVRVVNASLGGSSASLVDESMKKAIKAIHEKGLLIVYSAGNDAAEMQGAYMNYPCDVDEAPGSIGVIALSQDGDTFKRRSGSNYNMKNQTTKDLSAPGDSIYSTYKGGSDSYQRLSGTSMAAPFVSGTAALMFAANPTATPVEVEKVLHETAQDLGSAGWDDETGYGLVNAEAAVKAIAPHAPDGDGGQDGGSDDPPSGDDPSGDDPSGDDPSGDEPGGDDPSGDDPSGDGNPPSGDEPGDGNPPSGDDPSGEDPSGEDPDPAKPIEATAIYRLYNPYTGEHFYTEDLSEKDGLTKLGWRYEGEGWKAPKRSNAPVFRLYNAFGGEHHYTMSEAEKNTLTKLGWTYEGVGWYSSEAQSAPIYRQYNPNSEACNHNYTASREENDNLVSLGWRYEGVCWYGVA